MYFFITPILAITFIGWIFYHWLFKKDMRKYRKELLIGLVFLAVWGVVYIFLVNIKDPIFPLDF